MSCEKTSFKEMSIAVTPNIVPFSFVQGMERVKDGAMKNETYSHL
jgi:hypothetical protein